ncbi:MAG: Asp23/Gls24 family envelope stress response protein [Clostridiales bacterium]|nr:Asp23/Gls24 family envelope stress response protein [Clostridiales bacterium]
MSELGMTTLNQEENLGKLKVNDEVIAIIAGLAAVEVDGVYSMSGGLTGGIAEVLGIKNLSKGIKVDVKGEKVEVNIYIIANFGARIPDVAWNIQETVKKVVEKMTGMNIIEVNIHVQGINIPK